MQLKTHLIHHPYHAPGDFEAPQPAVHKASTVFFPNVAAMRSREWENKSAYTYGLHGTPTTLTLEERLCSLEGGLHCLLLPSGLAAIATVFLALLKTGDEVLLPDNVYNPSKALIEGEMQGFGVRFQYYDPLDLADLKARITPATKMVWLEAPGSVTLEFPDLLGMVSLCKARGICTVLDNTWGSGLAFAPFDLQGDGSHSLGVDVSVHALTKYPSGGGDVLMGSIITRDADWAMKLKLCHMRLGLGVAANDAELVLRALPSIELRYEAQDQAARALAQWCLAQNAFVQVLHPALPQSPGHAHWRRLCDPHGQGGRAAGLLSVILDPRYSQAQADAFCDALTLFRLGYSWGGPISLVVPYDLGSMRSRPPSGLAQGTLIRFCVGLEAVEDLQADLLQAMRSALPVLP